MNFKIRQSYFLIDIFEYFLEHFFIIYHLIILITFITFMFPKK